MKRSKKNNGGFTLVELVVVLVILAILAAALMPALTGYIDKARNQTVLGEGRSVYVAAQSEISEAYATNTLVDDTTVTKTGDSTFTAVTTGVSAEAINTLGEAPDGSTFSITFNARGEITAFSYVRNGVTVSLSDGALGVS